MDGLIFLYLILFPFGKLVGIIPDLIIATISLLSILLTKKINLSNFLITCIFSLFFSLSFFKLPEVFIGILYLIRLITYISFSYVILKKFGKQKEKKELIFNCLILIGISIAIFGWIQYFFFPDLRALKSLGWDDHYFRLVSTFLDPAFTGILLVLTEILLIVKTVQKRSNFYFLLNIFLVVTVLFTYSRASYLALILSVLFLFWRFRNKFIIFIAILFIFLLPVLPKPGGEGVNLARTYSITDRFINYKMSLKLIKESPIFGIGFNNVCVAKENFLKQEVSSSHSCSGLDNSILFILSTTGVVGLIIFGQTIFHIIKNTRFDFLGWALIASLLAILIHGMFTETFFYNFVLGWIAILIGITRIKD